MKRRKSTATDQAIDVIESLRPFWDGLISSCPTRVAAASWLEDVRRSGLAVDNY
jgi:hypothetical protein